MSVIDIIGWVGFIGVVLFYWLISNDKVIEAHICGIVGTLAFLALGIAVTTGHCTKVPSLLTMQVMVIALNIRGMVLWKKKRNINARS